MISPENKAITVDQKKPRALGHCNQDTLAAKPRIWVRFVKTWFSRSSDFEMRHPACLGERVFHRLALLGWRHSDTIQTQKCGIIATHEDLQSFSNQKGSVLGSSLLEWTFLGTSVQYR